EMVVNVWYYDPGEEMPHHAHNDQEELFYVLEGEFELILGKEGDTERETVGPGAFYAAGPGVGHGHKNVGDEEGAILAVGAPNVADINPETWTPVDDA
ncbi:MAG: cupin domain-containing protein, partial [Halorientalis sp.]